MNKYFNKNSKIKRFDRRTLNKRGAEVWISWVLLMAFVVALGAVISNWMQNYTQSQITNTKEKIYDSQVCQSVSIFLSEIYYKNPQTLNMKVTNNNLLLVDEVIFRVYNDDGALTYVQKKVTLRPYKSKDITVDINITNAHYVDAIPVVDNKESQIICRMRLARYEI